MFTSYFIYIYIYMIVCFSPPLCMLSNKRSTHVHSGRRQALDELGEHKPGRIKPGRIKRAALSLQNQKSYICWFLIRPRLYASE